MSSLFPALYSYLDDCTQSFADIPSERQIQLQAVSDYLREKQNQSATAQFVVICTHNSRRSHFGQLWLQAAAHYYGLASISTYSGGTEATAFNPRAVAAAQRAGFQILSPANSTNPHYEVSFGATLTPQFCFSKRFDHTANPQKNFAAIMVCTDADENCPFVPGAERRFSLPFIDPKAADDRPEEASIYDLRCRQIATQMAYICSKV